MMQILSPIAALLLALHGLSHLVGAAIYLRLSRVRGMPYKTTVLGGRAEIGDLGARLLGALYALATCGFVVAALAVLAGAGWWHPLLLCVALLSLVLAVLDADTALLGVVINLLIVAALLLGPGLHAGA